MKLLSPLVRRPDVEQRFNIDAYVEWLKMAGVGGTAAGLGVQTTLAGQRVEPIAENFAGYVCGGLKSNGIVWTCANVRMQVFSQARFMFQRIRAGKPGDLFGTPELARLERPWVGGTTGDLLGEMIMHADFAGNAYVAADDKGDLGLLRPDWTDIVLEERMFRGRPIGWRRVGYAHYSDGDRSKEPAVLLADEVAHFAPYPDPLASFRGMSWLTPVIREVTSDQAATIHKQKFFENAATPNMTVVLPPEVAPAVFDQFKERMEAAHMGASNAYKTLYLGGGADVTVVGKDFQQMDFKVVQGAGETRIAAASGVGAIIAQFSEGMQGSSLNAGNYGAARRRFSDIPMRHAWQNASGSLQNIITTPTDARLWYDASDVPFLQEDARDAADIEFVKAQTIRQLVDGGYDPASVVLAVEAQDMTLLQHTGKLSVQLQEPGVAGAPAEDSAPPVDVAQSDDGAAKRVAEVLQKAYLAVGPVITKDEARELANRAGATLEIPAPEPPAA